MEAKGKMMMSIETREVVGRFETREVVGGSPTDILYVLLRRSLLFLQETFYIR
jgi:hypothetical protein